MKTYKVQVTAMQNRPSLVRIAEKETATFDSWKKAWNRFNYMVDTYNLEGGVEYGGIEKNMEAGGRDYRVELLIEESNAFTYHDSEAGYQSKPFPTLVEIRDYIENFGWNGDSEGTVFEDEIPVLTYTSREDGIEWKTIEPGTTNYDETLLDTADSFETPNGSYFLDVHCWSDRTRKWCVTKDEKPLKWFYDRREAEEYFNSLRETTTNSEPVARANDPVLLEVHADLHRQNAELVEALKDAIHYMYKVYGPGLDEVNNVLGKMKSALKNAGAL